ncbi:hypothetical protein [Oceanisphaera sp. KMM 10153]|uniref:hypothetical protein n=1 Tax=Oceanisphaera submarina TaxID=3390193 RepID=UPI003974ACC1
MQYFFPMQLQCCKYRFFFISTASKTPDDQGIMQEREISALKFCDRTKQIMTMPRTQESICLSLFYHFPQGGGSPGSRTAISFTRNRSEGKGEDGKMNQ